MPKKPSVVFPNLNIEEGKICENCQIEKHTKISHKNAQHLTKFKVHELLHMDLMGTVQLESLGGGRYVFLYVHDFSRYTWVDFLQEKPYTFTKPMQTFTT